MEDKLLEEFKEIKELKRGVCPYCGRCPVCGRPEVALTPYYPDPYRDWSPTTTFYRGYPHFYSFCSWSLVGGDVS